MSIIHLPQTRVCDLNHVNPALKQGRIAANIAKLPATLFREFAAECTELAQTIPSHEKRALYLEMASFWHHMAQRWEKKV